MRKKVAPYILSLIDAQNIYIVSVRCRQRKKRYVNGQMGMQPILPITVLVKKIKGGTRQRYVVTLGVNRHF